jgi:hypothetical protein
LNKGFKRFLTLLTLISPILVNTIVYASVFTYYSSTLSFNSVLPPLHFLRADTPSTYSYIDYTNTSANVTVLGSNTPELVENPDYYSNPDYWYVASNASLTASWLPSDGGRVVA